MSDGVLQRGTLSEPVPERNILVGMERGVLLAQNRFNEDKADGMMTIVIEKESRVDTGGRG